MNDQAVFVIVTICESSPLTPYSFEWDQNTVVGGVSSTKEKARKKLEDLMKEFMKDQENDMKHCLPEDEYSSSREEIEQKGDDEFSVYGMVWKIVETTID
jgi:hypothetical protein